MVNPLRSFMIGDCAVIFKTLVQFHVWIDWGFAGNFKARAGRSLSPVFAVSNACQGLQRPRGAEELGASDHLICSLANFAMTFHRFKPETSPRMMSGDDMAGTLL
jgi:hypothetical protein